MRLSRHILLPVIILAAASLQKVSAQLGFQPDIVKPKPYENRVLKAEKTGTGKLKNSKRFFQNLTTHYNYYFNATNKLNEIIDRAKESYRDDYTDLLSFYNYSLDATAQDKIQLDSVIYKSKTGILNHDLRSDWMDNLYLLWGASYYFQKKFDSASMMFQFINYSFADKEKDGYYRYIGSNMDGNNALSVSTKEKTGFTQRLLTTPPSRNDAFIWQIRSLIESGNLPEAGSLIVTLKNDLSFPERLRSALEEVQAYWFYKQNMLDSSAAHLVKAFDQAGTKQELARWEYLTAQMYERTNKTEEAEKFYNKVLGHTTDPIMEIYTRLDLVRINKSGGQNYIERNIEELLKMARKDKYSDYRDVIYYMAAQMELDRGNKDVAQVYLLKSAKYNNGNITSKNNAFLTLADLLYDQKKYLLAGPFYDSIQPMRLASLSTGNANWNDPELLGRIDKRKSILSRLIMETSIVTRQDSFQKIASMPEQERTAFVTRLLKQIRKQQGLKDESVTSGSGFTNAPDLFPTSQKGEWYFYNTTLKSTGSVQFKQAWGNRPNVDNWRRFADVNQQLISKSPNNTRPLNGIDAVAENTVTLNSLMANLPIGDVRLKASNDSIKSALFNSGTIYMNDLEDYPTAIETFENLRNRFPDYTKMDETLFGLYYSYNKSGNYAKADEMKKLMSSKYATSRLTSIVNTGKDPSINTNNSESTKDYENIYDLFLEGKFEEAEAAKKNADSIYKTNHWQPQLLYIEAVYYIKQRNDSIAKNALQTLIAQNSGTGLAKKAQNLLQVLNRRKQIEEELTNLKVQRVSEDSVIVEAPPVAVVNRPHLVRNDSNLIKTKQPTLITNPVKPSDTSLKNPIVKNKVPGVYRFDPAMKHYVTIVLDKVDAVFVSEAKNAFNRYNQEQYYSQQYTIDITDLDADRKLLLIGNFPNAQAAIDYIIPTKRLAPNEIVPWLKKDKYSFTILSAYNLDVLKERKDMDQYKKFLDQNLPGKF